MKKLCCSGLFLLAVCIGGSSANYRKNCAEICARWRGSSQEEVPGCTCERDRDIFEVYLPDNKTITKRDTQSQPSKAPIVGQSNPTAHNRLIHQRARQRLHQQQQRARHHITPPTQHRRLHHGHARQHHITPHHHPHLVGSIRERFGGGDEQGGVLKRLSERRKQGKDGERTEGGSKIEKAETRSANEKQSQQKEAVQIITQAPNLIDERK